jgi:hypothetical protein
VTTGDDQGLEDGVITSLFNIPFTCLSTSFAKTSGSLRGGCADLVAMLCFTTLASKNVFARVMNPSADTQIIYPGTIVAQVSPVQEVVNPNSKIDEEGELRTDLINLYFIVQHSVYLFVHFLC